MRVTGEAKLAQFSKKHPRSRKPLARFLAISRAADWPHFPSVKDSFPAADYAPATGTIIFDVSGNKYRLIARVDFEEQIMHIESVLTHEEYDREIL